MTEVHDAGMVARAAERIAAIYADDRFALDATGASPLYRSVRSLAITLTWVNLVVKPKREDFWKTVIRAQCEMGSMRGVGVKESIRGDAPRYEPPDWNERGTCEAPMIRREGACGKSVAIGFRVTDWATGQWRIGGWCSKHRDLSRQASDAERRRRESGRVPEPVPNKGGLLAVHIPELNWHRLYAWARHDWTEPAVGMDRNAWPVPEKIAGIEPPQLRVYFGGKGTAVMDGLDDDFDRPALRVIKGE